jgi:hypothetical protein
VRFDHVASVIVNAMVLMAAQQKEKKRSASFSARARYETVIYL